MRINKTKTCAILLAVLFASLPPVSAEQIFGISLF